MENGNNLVMEERFKSNWRICGDCYHKDYFTGMDVGDSCPKCNGTDIKDKGKCLRCNEPNGCKDCKMYFYS